MFFGKKQVISINISDQRLKLVFLTRHGSEVSVKAVAKVDLEDGLIERGYIKDEVRLEKTFRDLLMQIAGPKYAEEDVVIIFPEAGVFSHFFKAVSRNEKALEGKIIEEALSSIPLNKEELLFDYKIIEKHKTGEVFKARASIVGANKQLAEEWVNFFKKLEILIDKFAIESLSTYQGLNLQGVSRPLCIVDIGANITSVAIFSDIGLEHSHSFFCAGNFFTKKISEGIKNNISEQLNVADAEKIKLELGSFDKQNYDDPAVVLKSAILPVVEDVAAAINYYQESRRKTIGDVILLGGSSNIKGVAEYIAGNLSASIAVVEDLPPVKIKVSLGLSLFDNIPIEYISAAGAAFAHLYDNLRKEQLMIPVEILSKHDEKEHQLEEDGDDGDDQREEQSSWLASHAKEATLILILIIGVVMIGGAFWYRSQETKRQSTEKDLSLILKNEKQMSGQIPTYILSGDASELKARVRIIRRMIRSSENIEDVRQKAPEEIATQIKKGESLWRKPFDVVVASSTPADKRRPEINFLVYINSLLKVVLEANLRKELGAGVDFLVKDVILNDVVLRDGAYFLKLDYKLLTATGEEAARLSSDDPDKITIKTKSVDKNAPSSTPIGQEEGSVSAEPSLRELSLMWATKKTEKKVVIKQSSVGFVNIRSGPNVEAGLIKRAYVREEYGFLEERDGWTKIAVASSSEAWVKNDFIEVK